MRLHISVSICPLNTVYDTVSSNSILTNLNFILCQCTRRDWTNVEVVHELLASLPENVNWLLQVLAWQINLPATLTLCSFDSLHVMMKVVLVVSATSYRHALVGRGIHHVNFNHTVISFIKDNRVVPANNTQVS